MTHKERSGAECSGTLVSSAFNTNETNPSRFPMRCSECHMIVWVDVSAWVEPVPA